MLSPSYYDYPLANSLFIKPAGKSFFAAAAAPYRHKIVMYRFDGQGAENEICLLTSFLLLSTCSDARAIAMVNEY